MLHVRIYLFFVVYNLVPFVSSTRSPFGGRFLLPSTYPTYGCNETACVSFPNSPFSTYCQGDSTCSTLTSLNLSVNYYINESSAIESLIDSWPTEVRNGSVTITRISDFLEFQLDSLPSKKDDIICNSTISCVATLTIPLLSNYLSSKPSVCLRLNPDSSGSRYYTALGYPPKSNGTSISSIMVANNATCYSSYFGKHAIYQYSIIVNPPPPSPPSLPPPQAGRPPPPPSSVFVSLAGYNFFYFEAKFSTDFDEVKSNFTLLSDLKSNVASTLATNLAAIMPSLFTTTTNFSSSSSSSVVQPAYERIEIYSVSRGSTIVLFRIWILNSTSTSVQSSLMSQLRDNTSALFMGSTYYSALNTSYVKVIGLPWEERKTRSLTLGIAISVPLIVVIGIVLLGLKYQVYQEVLPKPLEKER
mmetsp:Transcript_23163/g.41026  ORF Transcript_23163/g.41026 Transcript_23163/m.41026 type:complete len:416 (-) Transcript_23163:85-1332(-)